MKRFGFTLIELLVVIAIIGLIASVILASLGAARRKARDGRRLADLKELKLALSNFFDDNARYPDNTEGLNQLSAATNPNCGNQACITVTPKDPNGSDYPYYQCSTTLYHLGANLEDADHPVLLQDFDAIPSGCSGSPIDSDDGDGCAGEAGRYCYDTTP